MNDILAMDIGGGDLKYSYYNGEDIEYNIIPYTLGRDKRERFINTLNRVHSLYPACKDLAVVATFPVGAHKLCDDMRIMLLALKKFDSDNKWLLGGDGELRCFNTDSEVQSILTDTPVFVGASYAGFPLLCRNTGICRNGVFVEMGSVSTNLSYMDNEKIDYPDRRRPFFYGVAWNGTFFTDLGKICVTVPYGQYIVPTVPQALKSMHLLYFLYPDETNNLLTNYHLPRLKKEDVISRFATFINMDIDHIDRDALELTAEYMYNKFIFSLSEWIYRFRCYKAVNGQPIVCGGIGKNVLINALGNCTEEVVDIGEYTEQWHLVDLLGLLSEILRKSDYNSRDILEVVK